MGSAGTTERVLCPHVCRGRCGTRDGEVFVPIYTDSEDTLNNALCGKVDELVIGDVRYRITIRYLNETEVRTWAGN